MSPMDPQCNRLTPSAGTFTLHFEGPSGFFKPFLKQTVQGPPGICPRYRRHRASRFFKRCMALENALAALPVRKMETAQ